MKKKQSSCRALKIATLALAFVLTQGGLIAETVNIPDSFLRAAIRAALEKPSGDITVADMEMLTELSVHPPPGIYSLTGLERAINLTGLILSDAAPPFNRYTDLSPLSGLTKLKWLYVSGPTITDLSPLAGLTNLTEFHFEGEGLTDLSSLAGLTNLKRLILWCPKVIDLSPLAGLTNLTELMAGGGAITDLSPLAGLTNLVELNVGSDAITDISPLAGLTNLSVLELEGSGISDLSPLAGLTRLTQLHLGGDALTDIGPLAGLTNLTILSVGGNQFSDLSPLAGLINLDYLLLDGNQISDLSPLASMINLDSLRLNENQISDVSPLAGLTNLTSLWLDHNQISDLSPLAGLTNLAWINLGENQISDLSPLAELINLTRLWLDNNRIIEIGPLAGLTNLRGGCFWSCFPGLDLRHNYIDIAPGSPARQVIDSLSTNEELILEYEPQNGVRYVPVSIAQPPQSFTAAPGSTAIFTVTAGGPGGESYEWRHGDTVVGENSPIFTLTDVQDDHAGQYTVTVTAKGQSVSSRTVTLGVKGPDGDTGKLLNISTRGQILNGDKVMIAGFVLEGAEQKEVLLRGIGPGLGQWVDGVCTNPRLELFRVGDVSTAPMAANEAWGNLAVDMSGVCQRVGAFALESGSKDAALHMALDPGAYTAKVTALDGSGVGVVELYDADLDPEASSCQVVNISTRGEVGTESRILIAGFVVRGEVPKQVLIRGVGPGLVDFGVDGALINPVLTLYKAAELEPLRVASNNNWSDSPNAADIAMTATQAGAFDLVSGSKDAAILTWLEPGSYTAQVSGIGITTGVALVEVYEIQ